MFVQQVREQRHITGCLGELDEPLVATLGIGIHKHRSCRVFQNFSTCLFTGVCKSLLGIIYYQLFAKGIDKVLRTTRDDKLIGVGGRKLNGIANLVAPQSAARGDNHRIVLTCLDTP